jgi:hypothetical protein
MYFVTDENGVLYWQRKVIRMSDAAKILRRQRGDEEQGAA